jgi:LEA14-like dessication related protein
MKKALLIIGGLSVLGFGVYKYFKIQADLLSKYEWKIAGIKILKFNLTELAMQLTIRFTSKADLEAKIENIYLDLFLEGKNVGFVTETKPFIIPANGSSDVKLSVSINPQAVLKNITDIVLGVSKNKDIKLGINGYAKIKSGLFSATLPIVVETSLKEYLKNIPTIA